MLGTKTPIHPSSLATFERKKKKKKKVGLVCLSCKSGQRCMGDKIENKITLTEYSI